MVFKVAINENHSGFYLSKKALDMLSEIKGYKLKERHLDRFDPDLIKVIEELGDEASNGRSQIEVDEFPDYIDKEWIEISTYDSSEIACVNFGQAYDLTVDKYFDDKDKLLEEIARIKDAKAIYHSEL